MIDLLLHKARIDKSVGGLEEARSLAKDLLAAQKRRLPEQRRHPYEAQIALVETEILADASKPDEAVARLQEFVDQFSNEEVVIKGRVVGVPEAARALRSRLLDDSAFRTSFEASVHARIAAALKARDFAALAAIPTYFSNESPSEESLFALAKLYREDGKLAEAGRALRSLLREFPSHPRRAEAHLQLALVLAERKLLYDARRERDQGLALLDEATRAQHAAIVAELQRLLPEAADAVSLPAIVLPLRTHLVAGSDLTPIALKGQRPAAAPPFTLVANSSSYIALAPDGKQLWSAPLPTGGNVSLGARNVFATTAIAASVNAARFARWVGGDILIGDVHGITRIEPRSGKLVWHRPAQSPGAVASARAAIKSLGADLETLARKGHLNRRSPLPVFVLREELIVRIDPAHGVTAYRASDGDVIWSNDKATGVLAGAPSLVGQLLAIGRADPGRIEIFDVVAGKHLNTIETGTKEKPGVLLAPPLLDPLGRLCYIAGSGPAARSAAFHVVDTRNGAPLIERPIPVHSRYAAVLHADGAMAIFHDGSSGGKNLHFVELGAQQHTRIACEDMSREFNLVRDGAKLFVLTYKLGVPDEGARFFRIDMAARTALRYQRLDRAVAYSRPLLTRRYVAVAGSDGQAAHVRLFERDASKDMSPPSAVFSPLGGSAMTRVNTFAPDDPADARFDNPPSLAASGEGLLLSHPFGVFRLAAK